LLYNDVIFVFIVFYVDPASGLPYAINLYANIDLQYILHHRRHSNALDS